MLRQERERTDAVKNITPMECAYIAGFFDGEGSITIQHNLTAPRALNPNHTLVVACSNTDPVVILRIHEIFGGCLHYRKRVAINHKKVLQWSLRAAQCVPFLEVIRPYLRMKGPQMDIALTFQRSKSMRGPRTVTPEQILWREEQRREIRRLNDLEHIMHG